MAAAIADKLHNFQNGVDADFAVDTIVTSLADPHNPRHCAQLLCGCMISLFNSMSGRHNQAILRVNRPEVYDACIRFITVPRSNEEENRLEDEMNVCKCDVSDGRFKLLHDISAKVNARTYRDLGLAFARQVGNVLESTRLERKFHKVEKNQQRAAREGTVLPWPRSPQDLLPYGVGDSIATLAAWIELAEPNSTYLGLLGNIIDLFKKEVVPTILASSTLPGRIVSIAQSSLQLLTQVYPHEIDLAVGRMMQVAVCYEMLWLYFDQDESRALYAKAVERLGYSSPDQNPMHTCHLAIFLLSALVYFVPPGSQMADDIERMIDVFVDMGVKWHYCMNLPYDVEKYGPTIVDVARRRRELDKNPIMMAYENFVELSLGDRCWSPGCRQTFAGAGRAFAACSGCRRITYCSKECLARAWRHEDAPHRAVCKQIKYIVDVTHLELKPRRMPGAIPFETICVAREVDEGALADFNSHMAKLRKLMSLVPLQS